jgi:serine/threonine protein kinase
MSFSEPQNTEADPDPTSDYVELPPGSPLQACPHCEALIDITEREPLEVIDCPGCGQPFAVSGQISHYQIIEVAGRGGMGVVYKAYDPSLDRYVALKLLRKSQSNDAKLIELLETEAAITASISDSNVVRVYGTGRDRGRVFLAMELVEMGSLDDLIHLQGRVAEAQVLEVAIQIARGLNAAHQQGLIHRDVKPGNILFADAHTAKIVDFGLAIFMAQEENFRGEVWGTPYYVAPEKLDNEPEDFRSDMYSLGGTLFHALAGRPPFEAENASLVALKHLKSQAVRLQAFAPWVSNATAHIINRTLAKNPANRYQSYDELIHNLEYALEELQKNGNAPQQRARVVVTANAEEDQQIWTWVVLGMIAVVVALAGWLVVPKFFKKPVAEKSSKAVEIAAASAAKPANLEKEIDALAKREVSAPDDFQKIANNSSVFSGTDRAWAQFFEGLSQLALSHPAEARKAFEGVEPLATRLKDEAAGKFLRESAARLSQATPIDKSETKALNHLNYQAVALLAYGLHDWNLGKIDEGVALLRDFRNADLSASAAWLSPLKSLSSTFIEEFTLFGMEMDLLKAAKTPAQRNAIVARLKDISPALKARLDAALTGH